jgi:flagellar L-ring protein precursor FlgH
MKRKGFLICVSLLCSSVANASNRDQQTTSLANYVARMQISEAAAASPHAIGSCWADTGRLAFLASDYKAANVGDLITIAVVQDVTASNTGIVSNDRSLKSSSGIDSLPGRIHTGGVNPLLGLHSADALSGKGEASSTSSVRTQLSGKVVAVLPSGNLVIEAERAVTMNNERQKILLRGVVRPGDIGANNTVASNTIASLELEIKGKGVVSDGTRPPNFVTRLLLRLFNF